MAQDQLPAVLAELGRVEPVGQAFPVFKLGTIDVALPRRESKTGRGHKGFAVEGDPFMSVRGGRAPARLHDQRDRLGPADRRVPGSLRRARRPRARMSCASSIRSASATTRCACCARCSSPRGSSSTLEPESAQHLPRHRARRSAGRADLGRVREAAARRPSGRRSASRWRASSGVVEQLLPEMVPLYDCPQDPEWHPEGDVWTHTLMVIDKARRLNADLGRAPLAIVMLGAVCHDLGKPATTAVIDGRIKSPGHEAAGVGAGHGDTRPAERPHAGRRRRARAGARPRRRAPAAERVLQGQGDGDATARSGGSRSGSISSCSTRFARADCHGRTGTFDCSAMDWFIERARSLGVEHRAAGADPDGPPPARARRAARAADGRNPESRLRAAARRTS